MMSETVLLEKIKNLPDDYKEEVYDFVEKLEAQIKTNRNKKDKGVRGFGSLKGMIEMSDDFDEPLEDFKEYM